MPSWVITSLHSIFKKAWQRKLINELKSCRRSWGSWLRITEESIGTNEVYHVELIGYVISIFMIVNT